ncbi:hypothetical protein K437DRAFT_274936 [Tilletiaria anomala UBC 951]|uniref:Uncharacterized protein n=1 Tax=Tilletiaria anomala (strain ATCC 24038 / CBS 436.72 / UBC 951) TaxID=1037660 RepID=A0A066VNK8_TILAU|nr:uncharacterized protein K437DRAFT_274936 [Tilletiaria anomala UBC 951]KDN43327.1 hypothetical protein K437DRAFT_274936 [Tilletiaria anomala UBC 951]
MATLERSRPVREALPPAVLEEAYADAVSREAERTRLLEHLIVPLGEPKLATTAITTASLPELNLASLLTTTLTATPPQQHTVDQLEYPRNAASSLVSPIARDLVEDGEGEEEEEEEVLETLKDEHEDIFQDAHEADSDVQTDVGLQVIQLSSAVLDTMDHLLDALQETCASNFINDARRSIATIKSPAAEDDQTALQSLEACTHALQQISNSPYLNEDVLLLRTLYSLFNALSDVSLEPPEEGSLTPNQSSSPGKLKRRDSGVTLPGCSDELRDPFQDRSEVDGLGGLLRSIASFERHAGHAPSQSSSIWPNHSIDSPKSSPSQIELQETSSKEATHQSNLMTDLTIVLDLLFQVKTQVSYRRNRLRSQEMQTSPRALSHRGSIASSILSSSVNARDGDGPDASNGHLSRASLLSSTMTAAGGSMTDSKLEQSLSMLSLGTGTFGESSIQPPRYSDELHGFSSDMLSTAEKPIWEYQDSRQSQEALPASRETPLGMSSAPLSPIQDSTSAYGARTVQDLQILEASIDRAYSAIPQLADQRANHRPGQARELAISTLLDRMVGTPRMEDQRASPPRTPPISGAHASISDHNAETSKAGRSSSRRLSGANLRRRFSVGMFVSSVRAQSSIASLSDREKGKEKMSNMGDAVSSPLAEPSASRTAAHARNCSASVARANKDCFEEDILQLLSMNNARSRMMNQDAPMRPGPKASIVSPHVQSSISSVQYGSDAEATMSANNGMGSQTGRSLVRNEASAPDPGNIITSVGPHDTRDSANLQGAPQQGYSCVFSEWQTNIGAAVIMAWSPDGPVQGALTVIDPTTLAISLIQPSITLALRAPEYLRFECPQQADLSTTGRISLGRARGGVHQEELMASRVRAHQLRSISGLECKSCATTITSFTDACRCLPLPSEGWEELVDAWMCHDDQLLNATVLQGKSAISGGDSSNSTIFVSDFWFRVPISLVQLAEDVADPNLVGSEREWHRV